MDDEDDPRGGAGVAAKASAAAKDPWAILAASLEADTAQLASLRAAFSASGAPLELAPGTLVYGAGSPSLHPADRAYLVAEGEVEVGPVTSAVPGSGFAGAPASAVSSPGAVLGSPGGRGGARARGAVVFGVGQLFGLEGLHSRPLRPCRPAAAFVSFNDKAARGGRGAKLFVLRRSDFAYLKAATSMPGGGGGAAAMMMQQSPSSASSSGGGSSGDGSSSGGDKKSGGIWSLLKGSVAGDGGAKGRRGSVLSHPVHALVAKVDEHEHQLRVSS